MTEAFAGYHDALGRITGAYMQVHYGDLPVSRGHLAQLRRDYDRVRRAQQETHP